jgi:IMP cyclohydrolase
MLKIESLATTPHLTEECKRVIAQKAIVSFDGFFDEVENKGAVVAFVRRQLGSSRVALDRQAQVFLSRWG